MPNRRPLSELVVEYLAQRPGEVITPWQIAKDLSAHLNGRHVGTGAVTNICLHEAARGRLVQVDPAPLTFAHPARAEGDADQQ